MHLLEKPLEIERLALLALQLVDDKSSEEQFQAALPKAYRLLQLTEEFLDEKERQANEAAEEWRQSPAGQAFLAERQVRFEEMQKRVQRRDARGD